MVYFFNFYDGKIIGPVNTAIRGEITSIEEKNADNENLELVISNTTINEKNYKVITLGVNTDYFAQIANTYNVDLTNVNYIEENGYYKFHSLQDAIKACKNGVAAKIEIIKNIDKIGRAHV